MQRRLETSFLKCEACFFVSIQKILNAREKLNRLFFQITNVGFNPTRFVVAGQVFKQFSHSRGFANQHYFFALFIQNRFIITRDFF